MLCHVKCQVKVLFFVFVYCILLTSDLQYQLFIYGREFAVLFSLYLAYGTRRSAEIRPAPVFFFVEFVFHLIYMPSLIHAFLCVCCQTDGYVELPPTKMSTSSSASSSSSLSVAVAATPSPPESLCCTRMSATVAPIVASYICSKLLAP